MVERLTNSNFGTVNKIPCCLQGILGIHTYAIHQKLQVDSRKYLQNINYIVKHNAVLSATQTGFVTTAATWVTTEPMILNIAGVALISFP